LTITFQHLNKFNPHFGCKVFQLRKFFVSTDESNHIQSAEEINYKLTKLQL